MLLVGIIHNYTAVLLQTVTIPISHTGDMQDIGIAGSLKRESLAPGLIDRLLRRLTIFREGQRMEIQTVSQD